MPVAPNDQASDDPVYVSGTVTLAAGAVNIGDVDVLSIAAGDNNIGNVDLASAIPAGTNNIGDVDVASIAAGETHIGAVGGHTALVTAATMTRPGNTDAYASGDLVANDTVAGSVVPLSFAVARVAAGSGMIRRVRLRTSSTSVTLASFRLHLYSASPTVTNGDNGVWLSDNAANYLGALDITIDRAFSDGAAGNGVPVSGSEINFKLASGSTVYGLLEARAAYVPTNAGTFICSLEVLQN